MIEVVVESPISVRVAESSISVRVTEQAPIVVSVLEPAPLEDEDVGEVESGVGTAAGIGASAASGLGMGLSIGAGAASGTGTGAAIGGSEVEGVGAASGTGAGAASGSGVEEGGFPDATNTGVPTGTVLTPYAGPMQVVADDTIIEDKEITGTLEIQGDNVVVRRCLIHGGDFWGVLADNALNTTVEFSTIIGPGLLAAPNSGIVGSGRFERNDISSYAIGIQCGVGAGIVRSNYIHDLISGQVDPHYDGITCFGLQDGVVIENNSIWMPTENATASVFLQNFFGGITNIQILNNLMRGSPSYTVYVTGALTTNVEVSDNHMEEGSFGYFNFDDLPELPSGSGNVDAITGDPVPIA